MRKNPLTAADIYVCSPHVKRPSVYLQQSALTGLLLAALASCSFYMPGPRPNIEPQAQPRCATSALPPALDTFGSLFAAAMFATTPTCRPSESSGEFWSDLFTGCYDSGGLQFIAGITAAIAASAAATGFYKRAQCKKRWRNYRERQCLSIAGDPNCASPQTLPAPTQ